MTPSSMFWFGAVIFFGVFAWIVIWEYAKWKFKGQISDFKAQQRAAWRKNVELRKEIVKCRDRERLLKAEILDCYERIENEGT